MVRRMAGSIGLLALLFGLIIGLSSGGIALAQDDATPAASPASEETTDETGETDAGPNIVTLVAWYQPAEDGEFLELRPLRTSPTYVASGGDLTELDLTGTVDFEAPRNAGGLPRIVLGDSIFDAYPLVEGDRNTVQRWFWFDDEAGTRPATLVLQVTADTGPYLGARGTATFISRAPDSTGVLVIVLYLPDESEESE